MAVPIRLDGLYFVKGRWRDGSACWVGQDADVPAICYPTSAFRAAMRSRDFVLAAKLQAAAALGFNGHPAGASTDPASFAVREAEATLTPVEGRAAELFGHEPSGPVWYVAMDPETEAFVGDAYHIRGTLTALAEAKGLRPGGPVLTDDVTAARRFQHPDHPPALGVAIPAGFRMFSCSLRLLPAAGLCPESEADSGRDPSRGPRR